MQDYKSTQKLAQEREGASLPRPNPVIAAPSRGKGGAAAGGVPDLEQGLLQRDEEVERVALLQVSGGGLRPAGYPTWSIMHYAARRGSGDSGAAAGKHSHEGDGEREKGSSTRRCRGRLFCG